MSLREEEERKKNFPSRGLGLAAAAIGVGVGAALYYFFSKRPENPDEEGSTSGWACEQPHAFNICHEESDTSMENQCDTSNTSQESEYTTVSETTTTDTSVHNSSTSHSIVSDGFDSSVDELDNNIEDLMSNDDSFEADFVSDEWDMTHSSLDIPEQRQSWSQQSPLGAMMSALIHSPFVTRVNRRKTLEQEQRDLLRAQALSAEEHAKFLKAQRFRERSWSLEECSICFEIMLKDQQLTSLPCSHNFHSSCIAPWLAEQQTCPNCRKAAE